MSTVLQHQLEERHASFQQLPLLKEYFDGQINDPEIWDDMDEEDKEKILRFRVTRKKYINIISIVCLYRRLPLEALVNLFRHEEPQEVASLAEQLVHAGWLHWDATRDEFVTYELPTKLEQDVFGKRFPMPMLCKPRLLTSETDSVYLTEEKSQSVLGSYDGQVTNLETLDALNQIPLALNMFVVKNAPDPFKDDDKFRKDSVEVFWRMTDSTFYLTWQFDFRGRVYARGYHINPQGDSWHKHVIQFGE